MKILRISEENVKGNELTSFCKLCRTCTSKQSV